jgi:rod shape-determining protein MreC
VLGRTAPRPDGPPGPGSGVVRARFVAAVLVLVSLALLTVYLRESSDGGLHAAQRIGLSVLAPFEVAGERVARPFRDAAGWVSDVFDAKEENEQLRRQLEQLRQQLVEERTAAGDVERLRELLKYRSGPLFPEDYDSLGTRVIARPPTAYNQEVLIAAGSADGVERNAPVVTEDGLVGLVTEVASNAAKVTLLTDQASAVSAIVVQSGAPGVVRHGESSSTLVLDRVRKEQIVNVGDTVITAGWRSGKLESLYPRGIPIGTVTAVGQQDIDLYKRIQVGPLVDFDSLADVLVLVRKR